MLTQTKNLQLSRLVQIQILKTSPINIEIILI